MRVHYSTALVVVLVPLVENYRTADRAGYAWLEYMLALVRIQSVVAIPVAHSVVVEQTKSEGEAPWYKEIYYH